jgi:cytochrome c5
MRYLVMQLLGGWRLWWGFCPECNSDAPEKDTCVVCRNYQGFHPPSEEEKAAWWKRFKEQLGL